MRREKYYYYYKCMHCGSLFKHRPRYYDTLKHKDSGQFMAFCKLDCAYEYALDQYQQQQQQE
jgi:hypothetical protein